MNRSGDSPGNEVFRITSSEKSRFRTFSLHAIGCEVVMLVRRLSPNTPVVELCRIAAVAQAVEKHGMPQLICLELKLPDTHGVSGIRELKRIYPDVPILVQIPRQRIRTPGHRSRRRRLP
jgi:DNA-binding NarL/FixJ family response regulator